MAQVKERNERKLTTDSKRKKENVHYCENHMLARIDNSVLTCEIATQLIVLGHSKRRQHQSISEISYFHLLVSS